MTQIWSNALRRLSARITPQNFEMWLRPIECRKIEGHTLFLEAPNPYVRLWFESNYLSVVLDELRSDNGIEYQVEFIPEGSAEPAATTAPVRAFVAAAVMEAEQAPVPSPVFVPAQASTRGTMPARSYPRPPSPTAGGAQASHASAPGTVMTPQIGVAGAEPQAFERILSLNPRYTFDTFVEGPSNQLAFAASQAAAQAFPPKYNPVFICGGVGLGKTHLLHAIGHEYCQHRSGARIMYLSGEQFMNEYIHAIRSNRMHDFRRRYREGCDMLLIDDVQFLAGKDGTQDEFFHTFNALHDSHRQIVLTADRKPHEISDIADRLRTRFAWGLLADIEPPELEVRMAILRKKAAADSIQLPDDVVLYIASAIKSNVREARGRADSPGRVRLAGAARDHDRVRARDPRRLDRAPARAAHHRGRDQGRGQLLRAQDRRYQVGPATQGHCVAACRGHVPGPHAYQGQLSRPRTRLRRQAPHHGHLGRGKDRGEDQGRPRPAQRAPRHRERAAAHLSPPEGSRGCREAAARCSPRQQCLGTVAKSPSGLRVSLASLAQSVAMHRVLYASGVLLHPFPPGLMASCA